MIRATRAFGLLLSFSLVTVAACSGSSSAPASEEDPAASLPGSSAKTAGGSGPTAPSSSNKPAVPPGPTNPTTPAADPAPLPDGNVTSVPANCRGNNGVNGNGTITRTTRTAAGFTDVMSEFSGDVVIQEGSKFRVQVETDSNLQAFVTTDVQSGAIVLSTSPNTSVCFNFLRVIVTLPSLRAAILDGSGDVDFAKTSAASDVQLTSTGSGDIKFSGKAKALTLDLDGSGSIHLASGSATSTAVRLSGSGSIDANAFATGAVTKNVDGSGDVSF